MLETIVPIEHPVDLPYLRWHWGTAYRITRDRECWSARRLDGRGMLTARSGIELRDLIRDDYARRGVPRLTACRCGWARDKHDCYSRCPVRKPPGKLAWFW